MITRFNYAQDHLNIRTVVLSSMTSKHTRSSIAWLNLQVFGEQAAREEEDDDDDDDNLETVQDMVRDLIISDDDDDDDLPNVDTPSLDTPSLDTPSLDTPSLATNHPIATSALRTVVSNTSQPTPLTANPSVPGALNADIVTPESQIPAKPTAKRKSKNKSAPDPVSEDAPPQSDQPGASTRAAKRKAEEGGKNAEKAKR